MIKYLGSKRRVIPVVEAAMTSLPNVQTALDLFSGTSRVGQALRERRAKLLGICRADMKSAPV